MTKNLFIALALVASSAINCVDVKYYITGRDGVSRPVSPQEFKCRFPEPQNSSRAACSDNTFISIDSVSDNVLYDAYADVHEAAKNGSPTRDLKIMLRKSPFNNR